MPPTQIDSLVRDLQLSQDVELASAINDLKSNPAQLSQYIQRSSDNLYNTITQARTDAFSKAYGDMTRAADIQKNTYYYSQRNTDLNEIQKGFYKNIEGEASKTRNDSDIAKRQYEINEWSASNKLDTLFIFQMLFICILIETLGILLWRRGFFNVGILGIITVILAIIFIFTIVNRAQYTTMLRNNRYWNKRNFDVYSKKPLPISCPSLENIDQTIEGAYNSLTGSIQQTAQQAANTVGQGLISAGSSLTGGN